MTATEPRDARAAGDAAEVSGRPRRDPTPSVLDPAIAAGHRRDGWRMMRSSLRPSTRWIVYGVAGSISWAVGKIGLGLLAGTAVDSAVEPYDGPELVLWGIAIVVTGIFVALMTGLRRYAAFAISLRSEADLRRRMYAHLQLLHFAYHDRAQTGELMSRGSVDLKQVQTLLVFIPVTGANVLMVAMTTSVLFYINAELALWSLTPLPFLAIGSAVFSQKLHPIATAVQEEMADVASVSEESIAGIRVVKGSGAEPMQRERMTAATSRLYEESMNMARLRALFVPLLELLPTLGLVAVLYVGGRQIVEGDLTLGEFISFNVFIIYLIFPLRLLGLVIAQASRGAASAARVAEILATDPEILDRPGATPLPEGPGEIRFEGVTFRYGTNEPVLRDLDLHIRGGEAVALVGSTGSGKSTVARLVPRFYDIEAGSVRIDGADVADASLADVRKAVGTVFEDTFLFSDTIRANIAFAVPDASAEAIERAARLAGAHDFITEFPEGYDTPLGESGFSLSGGQRQRLALARTILTDPRVLILDDATSSVDPTKEHEIRAALRTVMEGRTTLIIAHRRATIALADRVLLLDHGRIVASGTHDHLLATSVSYREVLAEAEDDQTVDDGGGTP
ncbi:ABC transporter ATP-binding protein/permease [Acidimicrobiia bacterium EGI L10123]|uniref:ABC transporter ATP-binding protein n=1 Tax=Salinilacustrithrix flava TaxID=2957203 RepID=UPI003D7C145F|nr:ABC transporter ATP-binding protein/permease [Acidimicrobiia bacterium EGI L10123]